MSEPVDAHLLQMLNAHPHITHFELRPLSKQNEWQISYRDHLTKSPAYSGSVRGSIEDVVMCALKRADSIGEPIERVPPKPPRTTKTFRRPT